MSAYRRILVALDGSPTSMKGLREAIRLAKDNGAELVLVHAVNEYYRYAGLEGAAPGVDMVPTLREGGRRILSRARTLAEKQGVKARTILRERMGGPAAEVIVPEARRQRADLIVIGTHGRRGVRRLVMGSEAEQVVRASPVPVLLVRASR